MTINDDARRIASPDPAQLFAGALAPPLEFGDGEVTLDVEETELVESFELPGASLYGEELLVRVVPQQTDEFVCSRCFLIHHRRQMATIAGDPAVCRDCVS